MQFEIDFKYKISAFIYQVLMSDLIDISGNKKINLKTTLSINITLQNKLQFIMSKSIS